MLRKTVTNEGSLCYKMMHGAEGSFFSTNGPTNKNKVGEVALPTHLCVAALGFCIGTIIGQQIEKLGLDPITKGYLPYHGPCIETDKNIRFNC